jgi:hypothetical protein
MLRQRRQADYLKPSFLLAPKSLDATEITFGGSTAVVRGQRAEGTTKGRPVPYGEPRP